VNLREHAILGQIPLACLSKTMDTIIYVPIGSSFSYFPIPHRQCFKGLIPFCVLLRHMMKSSQHLVSTHGLDSHRPFTLTMSGFSDMPYMTRRSKFPCCNRASTEVNKRRLRNELSAVHRCSRIIRLTKLSVRQRTSIILNIRSALEIAYQ
jgi:hypothetical protein